VQELQQSEESNQRQLHNYLSTLFDKDINLGAAYHDQQLDMYVRFAPDKLLNFLRLSVHYSMERALQLCESRGMMREQVYLLGRTGNARQALMIIVEQLKDVQLVCFILIIANYCYKKDGV
jgi:hypothetical protein